MFDKNLLKNQRELLGLTQSELAEKVGTTKQNIYKYETGIITNIPISRIEKIANVLGISAEVLAGWGNAITMEQTQSNLTSDELELLGYYNKLSPIEKGRLLGELSIKCRDMENE